MNEDQINYLNRILSKEYEYLKLRLKVKREYQFFIVDLDCETADEIRDCLNEQLQKEGFDITYQLNVTGKILDELVDLFYTG